MFKVFTIINYIAWCVTCFGFWGIAYHKDNEEKIKKIFLIIVLLGIMAMLSSLWVQISYIYELIVPVAT